MGKRKKRKGKGGGNWFRSLFDGIKALLGALWRMLPVLLALGILAAGLFGLWNILKQDGRLSVQKILIQPAGALGDDVYGRLSSKYLGKSLFLLKLPAIAEELQADPLIKSAGVYRDFPSTLKIVIEKRVPVFRVRSEESGAYYSLSDDAVVLGGALPDDLRLMAIEILQEKVGKLRAGKKIDVRGFSGAVQFLNEFRRHPVLREERIEGFTLDSFGGLAFHYEEGPEVRMGRFPSEKIQTLVNALPILHGPDHEGIEYINLEFDEVIVKKKDAE
ncbi:MAG: cell division protein FtsQ/DivIB [Candidatus Omnitrophota bacterium]